MTDCTTEYGFSESEWSIAIGEKTIPAMELRKPYTIHFKSFKNWTIMVVNQTVFKIIYDKPFHDLIWKCTISFHFQYISFNAQSKLRRTYCDLSSNISKYEWFQLPLALLLSRRILYMFDRRQNLCERSKPQHFFLEWSCIIIPPKRDFLYSIKVLTLIYCINTDFNITNNNLFSFLFLMIFPFATICVVFYKYSLRPNYCSVKIMMYLFQIKMNLRRL